MSRFLQQAPTSEPGDSTNDPGKTATEPEESTNEPAFSPTNPAAAAFVAVGFFAPVQLLGGWSARKSRNAERTGDRLAFARCLCYTILSPFQGTTG
ncbi:MAG: hypothetical protein R3D28_10475 [Geminicoccaceae bacterium]